MRYQTTLSSNADGSSDIVTSDHSTSNVSRSQGVNSRCSSFLQLVFKDDEPKEMQAALRLLPLHSLSLEPGETFDAFAGNGDNTEPVSRVVGKHVVIIFRDCEDLEFSRSSSKRKQKSAHRFPDRRSPA